MDKNTEEFYERLKAELDINNPVWPAEYLFKFIVPTDDGKVKKGRRCLRLHGRRHQNHQIQNR